MVTVQVASEFTRRTVRAAFSVRRIPGFIVLYILFFAPINDSIMVAPSWCVPPLSADSLPRKVPGPGESRRMEAAAAIAAAHSAQNDGKGHGRQKMARVHHDGGDEDAPRHAFLNPARAPNVPSDLVHTSSISPGETVTMVGCLLRKHGSMGATGQPRWQETDAILTDDALYFFDKLHPGIACDHLRHVDVLHNGIFRSDIPAPVELKAAVHEPGMWARRVHSFFKRMTGQAVVSWCSLGLGIGL